MTGGAPAGAEGRPTPLRWLVTVVIATRDRGDQLQGTLHRLLDGPDGIDRPAVIVVDNASSDDTVAATRANHPEVLVVVLDRNEGAAARNIGAATAATAVVAFNDDDSWWAPGALRQAAALFAAHPRLGLLAARVQVGPDGRVDPLSEQMAHSPLVDRDPGGGASTLPGRPVLGFLACAAVVRRSAFLEVGGFSRTIFFLGEEALVAMDLAAGGWAVRYLDGLTVHHHPRASGRVPEWRLVQQRRNALLTMWLRRPATQAWRATADLAGQARSDPVARAALLAALGAAPAARSQRRVVPVAVEADLRRLERHRPRGR
ncbi:MAG: glycosyl transferase family 2 [Acidimicrobiales bacterium]|nr:glycosyl transferase family 2 [Acidimicrobiales bacterium]